MNARESKQFNLAQGDIAPGDDFDAERQAASLQPGRHHPAPAQAEILHALPETGHGIVIHRRAKFDLDGQHAPPFDNQKVDLKPRTAFEIVGGQNSVRQDNQAVNATARMRMAFIANPQAVASTLCAQTGGIRGFPSCCRCSISLKVAPSISVVISDHEPEA